MSLKFHLFGLRFVIAALVALALQPMSKAQAAGFLILQSTTSTQNSGLYDYLLPLFEKHVDFRVRVVAVGTGQALRNASNCDGDVLIVHAKAAELDFIAKGYGSERHDLMYNDFVLVGPSDDPAGLRQATSLNDALRRLAASKTPFLSRADDSGTHKKELALWKAAELDPRPDSGTWYLETGSGMGATLGAAVEIKGYTLSDRATWIAFAKKRDHTILYEGDPNLFNQYGVIPVSPQHCPRVKAERAQALMDWLLSAEGQAAIADYRRQGQQLFFPNAQN